MICVDEPKESDDDGEQQRVLEANTYSTSNLNVAIFVLPKHGEKSNKQNTAAIEIRPERRFE